MVTRRSECWLRKRGSTMFGLRRKFLPLSSLARVQALLRHLQGCQMEMLLDR